MKYAIVGTLTVVAVATSIFLGIPTLGGSVNVEAEKFPNSEIIPSRDAAVDENKESVKKQATFGAGCFWCVEAVFQEVKGVEQVVSGYTGGFVPNPTYEQVCTGRTGHAEVARLTYDPSVVTFPELLEIFWLTHDPTTLNRQGNDIGTQYRSAVFYHDAEQKEQAEFYKKKINESGAYRNPIVTEIVPLGEFYVAEKYHQNYFRSQPNVPYCRFVIQPKMDKFRKAFKEKLKGNK